MDEGITAKQFMIWANENPEEFAEFYADEIEEHLYNLEIDYFGVDGFDKRFT